MRPILISILLLSLAAILNGPDAQAAPALQLPWPAGAVHRINTGNQTYGCGTTHGGSGYESNYYAIDFEFAIGESVASTAKGTVTVASIGSNGGAGNYVEIDHGGGLKSRALHLRAINPWPANIYVGAVVTQGQVIAYSGSTPSVDPHLHFDLKLNGAAFKPETMSNVPDVVWSGQTFGQWGLCTGVASPSWTSVTPTWHGWDDLGAVASPTPGGVSYEMQPASIHMVRRDSGSPWDIYIKYWNGSAWAGWTNLSLSAGDPLFDGGVAISNHEGATHVVGVAQGNVWHKWRQGEGQWNNWTNLVRPPNGAINGPVAVANSGGRIHIVGVNAGTVFLRFWDGSAWSGWQNLGGNGTIGGSVAVADRGDKIHIVGFTPASAHVWMTWWNGISWQGFEDLGGSLDGALAIDNDGAVTGNTVLTPHYNVHIAAFSSGNVNLRCWDIDCHPSQWENQGGIYSGPVALTNKWAQIHLIAKASGSANLKHRWKG